MRLISPWASRSSQRRPAVTARRCAQDPDAVPDRAMLDLRKAKWSRVDGQDRGPGPHRVRRRFAGGGRSMARDRGTDRTRHRPAAVMQVSAAHRPSSIWRAGSWSSWAQSRLVGATGTRTSLPDAVTESLARRCEGKRADDFVMTTPAGTPLRLRNWHRVVFDPAVRAAGLLGVTPHDLRHTAASLTVSSGATVKPSSACSATPRRP
jgi:hypothetical protein